MPLRAMEPLPELLKIVAGKFKSQLFAAKTVYIGPLPEQGESHFAKKQSQSPARQRNQGGSVQGVPQGLGKFGLGAVVGNCIDRSPCLGVKEGPFAQRAQILKGNPGKSLFATGNGSAHPPFECGEHGG